VRTAVTVQTMVFGNAGGASGAGVGFTRDPATGVRELYFDFQFDDQGEDVVAGRQKLEDHDRLRRVLPVVWTRLKEICREDSCSETRARRADPTRDRPIPCLLSADQEADAHSGQRRPGASHGHR
jgi:phosphoenolpyruvate synthase/pyruvate phosphate dikinase